MQKETGFVKDLFDLYPWIFKVSVCFLPPLLKGWLLYQSALTPASESSSHEVSIAVDFVETNVEEEVFQT